MPVAIARRRTLPKPSPDSDPRFRKVMEDLKRGAARTKTHPPAARKAAEAAAAAKGPPNEKAAGAKSNQVDKIQEAPAKKPEPQSFLAQLRAEIQKAMPQTLGDTEQFMKGGSSGQLKGSLKGNVSQQKDEAAGGIKTAEKQPPNESGVPTKEAKPIPSEPAPAAPQVNAAEGMPAPKPDAEVSLQDSKQDADSQMKQAEVTPQQLQKANDPRFSAVLSAKDTVAKQADAAPASYRAGEKGALGEGASKASGDARKGTAAIAGVRGGSNSAVLSKQAAAKAKEEAERKQVTDTIEGIYNRTKTKVEEKLNSLETAVGTMFDTGVDAALKAMTDYVDDRMFKWKLQRYLGSPLGLVLWAKDKLLGLPPEVNAIYDAGRSLFTNLMDALVVRVAALVERTLKEAKGEVARGQAEIKTYVAGLSPNLRAVGEAAQKDVAGKFQELEQGIEDKKNQLAQQLAQKYKEAFDKANDALKKIQDENKGLVDVFMEKLGEVIKILTEFKAKLMALLKKGEDAIKLILADPVGFLGNLLAAIKQGFNQFVANIWTHLKKGFMTWLFGALAEAGIEIPSDLTLPSILKLVLSVLGITYDRMRAKAVKLIGETAVKILEKLFEYVKALITGGPAALWAKVKEDLGTLKEMVIDAIQSWLIETIVKRAIAKLVTLFNPVGAIVQAVLLIYDTVTFLIEKASQIMALIEAVINSVTAIAQGAIGGAATWIENALARTIPVVIGFLAQLLGLGGISKKIKEFILKVQNAVDKAIDKAIAKVVALVKKLFGKLTGKDKNKKEDRTEDEKKKDVERAVIDAQQLQARSKTADEVRKGFPAIKNKYRLTSIELTSDEQDTYHIDVVINPDRKTPKKKYKAKWNLASGGLEAHEGVTIMDATVSPPVGRQIHLFSRHGQDVPDTALIGRLTTLRALYNRLRTEKLQARKEEIARANEQLGTALRKGEKVERKQVLLAEAQAAFMTLNATQYTDVPNMYSQLEQWKVPPSSIPPRATRFRSNDILKTSVVAALEHNAQKIDEAMSAAGAKVGTRVELRHAFSQPIGVGYELTAAHEAVPIAAALKSVVVFVRMSNAANHEYMVETAYPEGYGG